jgi:hypothetical protein
MTHQVLDVARRMPLMVVAILLLAVCPTATTTNATTTSVAHSNNNNETTTKKVLLPRVQLQFICGYDVRATFQNENASRIFEDFYDTQTNIPNAHVRTSLLQMSGMEDIATSKWYYSSCNISSPQVLITLKMDGWATPPTTTTTSTNNDNGDDDDDGHNNNNHSHNNETAFSSSLAAELVTPMTLETYVEDHVCTDIVFFLAIVDEPSSSSSSSSKEDILDRESSMMSYERGKMDVDHTMFLLCGGADIVYYDDEDHVDSGFVLLGFMVGVVMVVMIFSELQKLDTGRAATPPPPPRRRLYATTNHQEFEMV